MFLQAPSRKHASVKPKRSNMELPSQGAMSKKSVSKTDVEDILGVTPQQTNAGPAFGETEKKKTIQEHIDNYYEGLEQLDIKMKKKREEMRMRAFDSAEYAQGGAQDCRIKKLLDEMDAKA